MLAIAAGGVAGGLCNCRVSNLRVLLVSEHAIERNHLNYACWLVTQSVLPLSVGWLVDHAALYSESFLTGRIFHGVMCSLHACCSPPLNALVPLQWDGLLVAQVTQRGLVTSEAATLSKRLTQREPLSAFSLKHPARDCPDAVQRGERDHGPGVQLRAQMVLI